MATPRKPAAEPTARPKPGGKFAQYQSRAAGKEKEPLVYGAEEGFDPEIVIPAPDVDTIDRINRCALDKDKLRELFGEKKRNDFERLWDEVGTWDMEAFKPFVKDVWAHFFGPGATDVPGGSARS